MKKGTVYLPILAVLLLCVFTGSLYSQNLAALKGDTNLDIPGERLVPISMLNPISVDFDNTPIGDALIEIAKKGQFNLNYIENFIPVDRRVSITMDNVPAVRALEEVLGHTATDFKVTNGGQVVLVPATRKVKIEYERSRTFQGTIRGVISEENTGRGLQGTNVVMLGTRFGASSGSGGEYEILNVPPGSYTLEVSFVGFATQTRDVIITAEQVTTANFELGVDILRLDEIVVTGTGTAIRKKELTTSIQTITTAEIDASPATNIQDLLQGRLKGGQVRSFSGQYGEGKNMRLRGFTSLTADQTPVIYVDGVRVENRSNLGLALDGQGTSALSDIHVENIDRIEVIKGGAASTLYGSEAAAGVIQIFTKRATPGLAQWRFNVEQGWDDPDDRYLEGLDPDRLIRDLEFSKSQFSRYSAGVAGGTEFATYDVSLTMQENTGVYHKTGHKYYGLNSSFQMFPTEKLSFNIQTRVSRDRYDRTWSNAGFRSAVVAVLLADPPFKPQSFDPAFTDERKAEEIRLYHLPDAHDIVWRYGFGITSNYDYNQYLNSTVTLGLDYRKNEDRYFEPIEFNKIAQSRRGLLERGDREFMSFTFDLKANLRYPQSGDVTSTFTWGVQGFRRSTRQVLTSGTDFGLPGTEDFDNAGRINASERNSEIFNGGILFNEQVGLWDKLFLTAGVRVDGNTAFGLQGKTSGMETATYPKFAAAYNISDEDFWGESRLFEEIIPTLKLRAAWGQTGSFPGVFTRDRTFSQASFRDRASAQFGNPGNPNIKPEKTTTTEFGADVAFFNGKLGLDISYYLDKTEDALLFVPTDPSAAQADAQQNVGEIENKGWDISGNLNLWNTRKVRLDLGGGFTTINNKITSLGGVPGFELDFLNRIEVGQPMGILEVSFPVSDGAGGFTGESENRLLQPFADKIYNLGLYASIGNNFNVQVTGDGQMGGHTFNITRLFRYSAEGALQPGFQSGDHMVFNGGLVPDGYFEDDSFASFFEKSDYFKIRELSATYRLPQRIHGTSIAVNFAARNFWNVFVPNKTIDPELDADGQGTAVGSQRGDGVNLGINSSNQADFSPAREYRIGVRLNF